MSAKKGKPCKNGNGAAHARKRATPTSKKVGTRDAKTGAFVAGGASASRKRKPAEKGSGKRTANELTLLAWEATYANRHRRLTD
jgi:fructose-1-phosphate kinase PfkB-like protein